MKKIKRVGVHGRTITLIIPENKKDLEVIRTMDKAGEIDTAAGFGDYRIKKSSKSGKYVIKDRTRHHHDTPVPA